MAFFFVSDIRSNTNNVIECNYDNPYDVSHWFIISDSIYDDWCSYLFATKL